MGVGTEFAFSNDVPCATLTTVLVWLVRKVGVENEVVASREVLEREMFDEHRAEAVFAVVDGREVGFALYFYNFLKSATNSFGC